MDIAAGLATASAALTTVRQLAEIDKALTLGKLKMKVASLYRDLADVKIALPAQPAYTSRCETDQLSFAR